MTIGDRIREERKAKGMTMAELGEKIHTSAAAVSRYELGQRSISLKLLQEIASALEIPIGTLMYFVEGEDKEKVEKLVSNFPNSPIIEYGDKITIPMISSPEIRKERISRDFESLDEASQHLALVLMRDFKALTLAGQRKAVDYLEDLIKVADYQLKSSDP